MPLYLIDSQNIAQIFSFKIDKIDYFGDACSAKTIEIFLLLNTNKFDSVGSILGGSDAPPPDGRP